MNGKDNYLDKTCAWLRTVLALVERGKEIPVLYAGRSSSYANAPAPHLELTFLTEGSGVDLCLGSQRHWLAKNCACLHSVHHGVFARGRPIFSCYCAFLDVSRNEAFAALARAPVLVQTPVRRPRRLQECFEKLILCCRRYERVSPCYPPPHGFPPRVSGRRSDLPFKVFIQAALLELLATLLEEAINRATRFQPLLPEAIRRAQEFLDLNYHRSRLTREDLSTVVHLDPDHLGRLFKRYLGQSVGQYLRQLRIGRSCFLLRQTPLPIKEISREVGFDDSFYFSRTFRSLMGISPRDYRGS